MFVENRNDHVPVGVGALPLDDIFPPNTWKRLSVCTGWQKVVGAMENSSYFESLEAKAKEMYHEKLSCIG